MPKFYQHFEPNDNFGQITRLKYIDDVSDDDFILYVFADGTKCNKEFVGAVDTSDPIRMKYVVVELASPTHKWTLTKNVIESDKPEPTMGEDGIIYEPVEYTVDVRSGKNKVKDGTVKINAVAPQLPRRWEVEPEEDYLLSLHPELETSGQPVKRDKIDKPSINKSEPVQIVETNKVIEEPEIADVEEVIPDIAVKDNFTNGEYIYINEDNHPVNFNNLSVPSINLDVLRLKGVDAVHIVSGGINIDVPLDKIESVLYESKKNYVGDDIIARENPLIKNMIDMAKKTVSEITMDIALELPPKCVYDTIHNSYSEALAAEFVQSLTARISQENLIAALADGLALYYEGKIKQDAE